MPEAQCFHCKKAVEVQDASLVRTSNQRLRLKGQCSECGKSVSQFVADPERPQLSPEQKRENELKRREERKKRLSESPKKTIKKKSIKPCARCACVAHVEQTEQPKKKRRVSKKEKLEKENEKLKQELEFLKNHSDGENSSSSEQA